MSQPIPGPKLRVLAQQLLTYEAGRNTDARATTPAVFLVIETFRRSLGRLSGETGFRALLSRALTLAKKQAPELSAMEIESNGALTGFGERNNGQRAEADILLIAQLLGLLGTFVGESITLRLVREAWPDVSFDTLSSDEKEPI